MNVPKHRMDCHIEVATTRHWIRGKKLMTDAEIERSRWCGAFSSKEQREEFQGASCDGCARIPEDQR